jgi:hypothetical protein
MTHVNTNRQSKTQVNIHRKSPTDYSSFFSPPGLGDLFGDAERERIFSADGERERE